MTCHDRLCLGRCYCSIDLTLTTCVLFSTQLLCIHSCSGKRFRSISANPVGHLMTLRDSNRTYTSPGHCTTHAAIDTNIFAAYSKSSVPLFNPMQENSSCRKPNTRFVGPRTCKESPFSHRSIANPTRSWPCRTRRALENPKNTSSCRRPLRDTSRPIRGHVAVEHLLQHLRPHRFGQVIIHSHF